MSYLFDKQGRPISVQPTEDNPKPEKPDWPAREGYFWNRTIFGGWVQTAEANRDNPVMNPAYERYWCM